VGPNSDWNGVPGYESGFPKRNLICGDWSVLSSSWNEFETYLVFPPIIEDGVAWLKSVRSWSAATPNVQSATCSTLLQGEEIIVKSFEAGKLDEMVYGGPWPQGERSLRWLPSSLGRI
jgi:hypothetical protein